jgi:phosphoribosyl-AMP cyclohydrolase
MENFKEIKKDVIEQLKFDDKGLIPAVVQDVDSKKVLMVAYMNLESLKITLDKKKACFWSRSRQELWLKGETSGNYQEVKEIVENESYDLIETVAEEIAQKLLTKFNELEQVKVIVKKPEVPIPGILNRAEVEIERSRS